MVRIREYEMGWEYSTYGEELHTVFWWGNVGERNHLEDPGVDGRIILKRVFMKWDVGP
jgi:hypothetical protein